MKKLIISLTVLILMAGCGAPGGDEAAARQALTEFFKHLNNTEYEQAVALYGGDYQVMSEWNPDLDPENHAALWENGCTLNGLQCLEIRSATLKEQTGDTLVFTVEFNGPNGTLFTLGPCCGADETQQPSVSEFEYRLQKTADGKFLVLDQPVYVP